MKTRYILIFIGAVFFTVFFIKKCNKNSDAEKSFLNIEEHPNIESCTTFLKLYGDTDFNLQVDSILNILCEAEFNEAKQTNTLEAWRSYKWKVPRSKHLVNVDSVIEIHQDLWYANKAEQEDLKWKTEALAWEAVQMRKTIYDYKKYLKLYPHGVHYKEVIDLLVQSIMAGEYGSLPQMNRTSGKNSISNTIEVNNSTDYPLTVLYTGTDIQQLKIQPNKTTSIRLKSGNYKIAAFVEANIRSYAGEEQLIGGTYKVKYYISSSKY